MKLAAALCLMLAGAASAAPQICNGKAEYCGRKYNQLTYPATHDSYTVLKYIDRLHKWIPFHQLVTYIGFVDQDGTITEQLDAGIRAFDLRLVADEHGTPQLCHARGGECQSEAKFIKGVEAALKHPTHAKAELAKVFENVSMAFSSPDKVTDEFKRWMDKHPNEVITISYATVSNSITVDYTESLLKKHGLYQYLQGHQNGTEWPTLGEMIASKKRLVVMSGNGKGDILGKPPYVSMSSGWQSKWATKDVIADCGNLTAADFGVDTLSELNHKLTMSIARLRDPHFNTKALKTHLDTCVAKYKRGPTFLYVDFYKASWVVKLAGELNAKNGKL